MLCSLAGPGTKKATVHSFYHRHRVDSLFSSSELLFRSVGIALSLSFIAFGCPRPSLQGVGESRWDVLTRFSVCGVLNSGVMIVVLGNTSRSLSPVQFSLPPGRQLPSSSPP